MKRIAILISCVVLMAGFVWAQETREITGENELVQEKGKFAGTWVRPGADFSKYSKLHMWDSVFTFREGGDTSTGTTMKFMAGDMSGPYALSEDSKEKFEEIVNDAIVRELGSGKLFEISDTVDKNTLLVRAGVLDIVSYVPPNADRIGNIHLASVGEGTIFFELIDPVTGVIQARVAERRAIRPQERMRGVNTAPVNEASVWNDVKRWASDEARVLRKELEKAKKKDQ